ncbi:MAG TPA: cation transporter [bacterium]|nr:cation transporter [bacterium]
MDPLPSSPVHSRPDVTDRRVELVRAGRLCHSPRGLYPAHARRTDASPLVIALAVAALIVMPVLVRAKRQIATAINSAALKGDAACGIVCAYMAGTLLLGLGLRAVFGWWWADPVAALGLVYFIVKDGREALTSKCGCCCDH